MAEADLSTPTPVEQRVESSHTLDLPTGPLTYTATAGTVLVRDDDATPLASMFYLAYVAEPAAGAPRRPITFLFNGGPGSASLWLNIGGFGPRRAPTATPHATPPAPYTVVDNPYTLLTESDLVFLDAPGTGYSRLLGDTKPEQIWGVDQDADAFARAITRYLTITNNWNAPRFLFGESYGTTRAAALVHRLQNQGLDFNGVVLLSTVLNWGQSNLGFDQEHINLLPSLAATAWYHGRSRAGASSLDQLLAEAKDFAQGDYARVLQLGDRVTPQDEDAAAERFAALTGLAKEEVLAKHLRIGMEPFRYALLKDEGRVVGRFDTRFVADHQYVVGTGSHDPATDDAATAGVNSAHLSTFRQIMAGELGYTSELHYRHLYNMKISGAWDWSHKAPGIDARSQVPDVSLDLSAAMRRNPNLRVAVMGGVYDLATPFFGAEVDVAKLYLAPRLRSNIAFHFYESGHMTFVDERVVAQMQKDLKDFYATATDR
ncbi:S10 family peptidase [Microbacterium album]|uniref:Carboxypeptidase n=1 Tax=Microbacterium album TaxID=2053191 RepID=A0A917ICN3_9MICO|nr:peptidase S10 [Microbacterium album]GGH33384.1 carboxypeptidase [Microbacterium album]